VSDYLRERREAVAVAGGFLLLLLALWAAQLRGLGAERRDRQRIVDAGEAREQELFGGEATAGEATVRARAENGRLREAADRVRGRIFFAMPEPGEIPPWPEDRLFRLRTTLTAREAKFRNETLRGYNLQAGFPLDADASYRSMGFELPSTGQEASEAFFADFTRKMAVFDRFVALVCAASEAAEAGQAGRPPPARGPGRPIVAIHDVQPMRGPIHADTRLPDNFSFREYRFKARLRVSMEGLLALLEQAGRPETFHVVRRLEFVPAREGAARVSWPEVRTLESVTAGDGGRRDTYERRAVNYYDIDLELATLAEIPAGEAQPGSGRAPPGRQPGRPTRTGPDAGMSGDEPPPPARRGPVMH